MLDVNEDDIEITYSIETKELKLKTKMCTMRDTWEEFLSEAREAAQQHPIIGKSDSKMFYWL